MVCVTAQHTEGTIIPVSLFCCWKTSSLGLVSLSCLHRHYWTLHFPSCSKESSSHPFTFSFSFSEGGREAKYSYNINYERDQGRTKIENSGSMFIEDFLRGKKVRSGIEENIEVRGQGIL